jgi:hypothetical protein
MQTLVLDLSDSPLLAERPLALVHDGERAQTAVTPQAAVTVIPGLEVPWAPVHGVSLVLARESTGMTYLFLTPGRVAREQFPPWLDVEVLRAGVVKDLRLTLLLPRHPLIRMIEFRSHGPRRWYSRWLVGDDAGVWSADAVPLSPT